MRFVGGGARFRDGSTKSGWDSESHGGMVGVGVELSSLSVACGSIVGRIKSSPGLIVQGS